MLEKKKYKKLLLKITTSLTAFAINKQATGITTAVASSIQFNFNCALKIIIRFAIVAFISLIFLFKYRSLFILVNYKNFCTHQIFKFSKYFFNIFNYNLFLFIFKRRHHIITNKKITSAAKKNIIKPLLNFFSKFKKNIFINTYLCLLINYLPPFYFYFFKKLANVKYFVVNNTLQRFNNSTCFLNFTAIFYLQSFLYKYLEELFKKKIYCKFNKIVIYEQIDRYFINKLNLQLKHYRNIVGRGFFLKELLSVFLITLKYKDTTFFKNWLINTFEKIHFKSHKRLLQFLKLFFFKCSKILFDKYCCNGFKLEFAGKIGVAGNAKKRKYHISNGLTSLNSKYLKTVISIGQIRTTTGVLGFTCIITFI